jgi:type IV pilus assembly protein PilM
VRVSSLPSRRPVRPGSRRSASSVALDIGADAVVALPSGGDGARRAIVHPLPVGIVVDGEVVDSAALAGELRTLFGEHKLPRVVRVGLAHPRLMVRLVELPASIDGSDLDNAVRHLSTDLLPVDLDQLVVDYRRIGNAPGAERGLQRVLMAAARVDGLDRLTSALDEAGLRVQAIALSGLAMVAALDHSPLPGQATLYVQAGALTNVVITENAQPLLVRAASAGSEAIAQGLAERAGISHELARAHISAHGLGTAPQDGAAPVAGELRATVTQQVREGLRRVVAEVQSSRGVYAARADACPIGAVVLTGSMSTWPGVVQALEADLQLPVLSGGRDGWPSIDGLGVAPQRLDVVVGLDGAAAGERPDLRPAAVSTVLASTPLTAVAQASCAVLAVLAAAIVYLVVISNHVSSGREQLATVAGQLVSAERQTAALKPYDDFAKAALVRREAVVALAKGRFNWDRAFRQLADVAPAGVWLISAKATLTSTTAVDDGVSGGQTGTLRDALPGPALELAGCAERERLVPVYMNRLHAMTAASQVGFSRSERIAATGTTGTAATGTCATGTASFALVVYFKATAPQLAATAAAAAGATAAPVTPAAGTTAATNTATDPTAPSSATPSSQAGGSR